MQRGRGLSVPTAVDIADSAYVAFYGVALCPVQLSVNSPSSHQVSSDLRVNSHPHMHIMRSRGLGLQLSPGALGPLPQHTSTAQKGDIDAQHPTSIDTDMSFKELVDGWREAWASPSMDLHRLSMWSDPEAGFQVCIRARGPRCLLQSAFLLLI